MLPHACIPLHMCLNSFAQFQHANISLVHVWRPGTLTVCLWIKLCVKMVSHIVLNKANILIYYYYINILYKCTNKSLKYKVRIVPGYLTDGKVTWRTCSCIQISVYYLRKLFVQHKKPVFSSRDPNKTLVVHQVTTCINVNLQKTGEERKSQLKLKISTLKRRRLSFYRFDKFIPASRWGVSQCRWD